MASGRVVGASGSILTFESLFPLASVKTRKPEIKAAKARAYSGSSSSVSEPGMT
jgi:hypothetical protein